MKSYTSRTMNGYLKRIVSMLWKEAFYTCFTIIALYVHANFDINLLYFSERTTDHGQATGKLYHLRLLVECTLFSSPGHHFCHHLASVKMFLSTDLWIILQKVAIFIFQIQKNKTVIGTSVLNKKKIKKYPHTEML
jgi:hypothetical protein